ncbi:hypothetical protein FIBSPDRAFT_1035767 [Athelia psychrophila]|uniref:MYND-type domain-containing protein n=1 Tax=Athelia psychrophila TaxID=1759441 RepID=A0A166WHN2_9AGAM|nr:hypothetical protein FIBSPDRAFT_1035767 [Fibularhizoctonia sp. CBS 109695]
MLKPLHKIQLPAKFVQELLDKPGFSDPESYVFNPSYHALRVKMVSGPGGQVDLSSDLRVCPPDPQTVELGFGEQAKRTALHYGSALGDPLLVCELIRIGATIDFRDAAGATPLMLAIKFLTAMWVNASKPTSSLRASQGFTDLFSRSEFIIRTLVEQHANVNIPCDAIDPAHPQFTPIMFACTMKHWDIIALLLEHGATAPPLIINFSGAECHRLNLLVKKYANKPRPARPCPCWSGQLLSLCHAAEDKPFPPEFICRCGSGKTYGRCCARRNAMRMIERWDPSEDWIRPATYSKLPKSLVSPEDIDRLQTIQATTVMFEGLRQSLGFPKSPEVERIDFRHEVANKLESQGHIDAAFAYAIRKVHLFPRPVGQSISKRDSLDTQYAWNKVIDQYIDLNTDPRSRDQIERAAKIGRECGALYRACDGPNCQTTEGPNLPKLKKCSKCKVGVYCSQECQLRSWRLTHKAECNQPGQTEQALPSQKAIAKYVSSEIKEFASVTDLLKPIGDLLQTVGFETSG